MENLEFCSLTQQIAAFHLSEPSEWLRNYNIYIPKQTLGGGGAELMAEIKHICMKNESGVELISLVVKLEKVFD